MNRTSLMAADFKHLLKLAGKMETLQAQIDQIEAPLAAGAGGDSGRATPPTTLGRP